MRFEQQIRNLTSHIYTYKTLHLRTILMENIWEKQFSILLLTKHLAEELPSIHHTLIAWKLRRNWYKKVEF
jgi:hypothetical protein